MNTGIIPARAGFTASVSVSGSRPRDHPRSRGVYHCDPRAKRAPAGSSPLARGLPTSGQVGGEAFRIIPARAGFTSGVALSDSPVGDHPRSRGVYEQ